VEPDRFLAGIAHNRLYKHHQRESLCSRYAARRGTDLPERCSRARVRFAAQNLRALAPSAPFRPMQQIATGGSGGNTTLVTGSHMILYKEGDLRLPS